MDAQLQEVEKLRRHLLRCSDVAPSSLAMQSCLKALETQRDKIVRDEKLRQKFANGTSTVTTSASTVAVEAGASNSAYDSSAVMVERERKRPVSAADPDEEDWQDVAASSSRGNSPRPPRFSSTGSNTADDDDDDEAMRVDNEEELDNNNQDANSMIGKSLSQAAVSTLAAAQVAVHTPLSLLAVALHSALRYEILDFQCTGIPPTAKESAGFAPTIRALPKNVFLPKYWEADASVCTTTGDSGTVASLGHVNLRYRKHDLQGPVVLHVALLQRLVGPDMESVPSLLSNYLKKNGAQTAFVWEKMSVADMEKLQVQVSFGPPQSNGMVQANDLTQAWTFPLGQHVNIASFSAARKAAAAASKGIPPSLHYKSLAKLFTSFIHQFDLGSVQDCPTMASSDAYLNKVAQDMVQQAVDNTTSTIGTSTQMKDTPQPPSNSFATKPMKVFAPPLTQQPFVDRGICDDPLRVPDRPLIQTTEFITDPRRYNHPGGDFGDDLAPGGFGPLPNSGGLAPPGSGGNLMGPNHPAFRGGDYDNSNSLGGGDFNNPGGVGGLGMRPRFDPFGPPGGPTDPDNGGGLCPDPRRGNGNGRGRMRGQRGGNPNPDHMRPPNDFGGNMFM
jgi:hypothetical protein